MLATPRDLHRRRLRANVSPFLRHNPPATCANILNIPRPDAVDAHLAIVVVARNRAPIVCARIAPGVALYLRFFQQHEARGSSPRCKVTEKPMKQRPSSLA